MTYSSGHCVGLTPTSLAGSPSLAKYSLLPSYERAILVRHHKGTTKNTNRRRGYKVKRKKERGSGKEKRKSS